MNFIKTHIVSWIIEILILSTIAFFTISETRKTAEQTRQMLTDVSAYASERAKIIDKKTGDAYDTTKDKLKDIDLKDAASKLFRQHK